MAVAQEFQQGRQTALALAASTVVKTGSGRVARVSVTVAGSAAGSINDCATTGAAVTANALAVIPNVVGVYLLDLPYNTGLVFVPGAGMTATVSYS